MSLPPPAKLIASFLSLKPPPIMLPAAESLSFSSPESLSSFLSPLLPLLPSWGSSPGSKSLHNLFLELSLGETSLSLSPAPLRSLHVAIVRIRNPRGGGAAAAAWLVESHQLLSDGTVRRRSRPLSEKMRHGETAEQAALRAVEEELGVSAGSGSVRVVPGSYEVRVEEKESVSYPGLPARYVLHSVEAEVEGLPEEGEFSTEEMGEEVRIGSGSGSAVFVRRHFWKWVQEDSSA